MSFRRRQRSKHHHAAHSGNHVHPPPPVHALIPQGEPELIADSAALDAFLGHARSIGQFAFDTEFIGESTYQPKTCLIQLSTAERIALVDPIALPDVGAVWSLVGDPSVLTIVHAGASDLSPVRRHLGHEPANLVDVQVAAGFVGMAYPSSLAKLVERFAGHGLAKGHTFTDWDARPLSHSQLRYAADDVRYLPLVWNVLGEELVRRGRVRWVEQETMARLEDPHVFDATTHARRAARGYDLTEAQESLLAALCVARDEIARRENLPHRTTIPDGSLLEIVRDRPETRAALNDVRGMPRPIVARHGDALLAVLERHPSERTSWFSVRKRNADTPDARAIVDRMLAETVRASEELSIASQLVTTRSDLARYVHRSLTAGEPLPCPPPLFAPDDWRSEAFGDRIESAGTGPTE